MADCRLKTYAGRSSRHVAAICLLGWLVLLGGAESLHAEPLAAYRERVGRALSVAETLLPQAEEEDVLVVEAEGTAVALRALRETLPPRLQIEWEGGALEADNSWLGAALDDYESQAAARLDGENRQALERIVERLRALDQSLDELEASRRAEGAATGAENRERLGAILRRLEGDRQKEEETALARLQAYLKEILRQLLEWLRQLIPDIPRLQPSANSGASGLFNAIARFVIYALVLGLLALLAWKFGPTAFGRLRRKRENRPSGPRVILGERIEADQTSAELLAEAEALARAGEPRAAVRKAYIALLCELGDRKLLQLAQHKTNRDYLRALEKRPRLYAEVRPLTTSYERFWYGAEPAVEADWASFAEGCRQAFALTKQSAA